MGIKQQIRELPDEASLYYLGPSDDPLIVKALGVKDSATQKTLCKSFDLKALVASHDRLKEAADAFLSVEHCVRGDNPELQELEAAIEEAEKL